MRKGKRFYTGIVISILALLSCGQSDPPPAVPDSPEARTPVTVTTVSIQGLEEAVELNATSAFLQKSFVKATANGYVKSVSVLFGNPVSKGQSMFTLKTKEAESLGNTINQLDPSFRFTGLINIPANATGYVTQLDHQVGDYVQDGEQLAVISNRNSFVFLLNLPYELRPYLNANQNPEITLPDGEKLTGTVSYSLPSLDSASQTQSIAIRVSASHPIPENLIAKVRLLKKARPNAQSLPKSAVLANETQTEFWVMKLTDTATAVKVPVIKGLEAAEQVEIISPVFSPTDKIITSGNYGLGDTAKIKVVSRQ